MMSVGSVEHRTALLRESDNPPWDGIRDELAAQGIRLDQVVVAGYADGGPGMDCLLVVADGRVIEFNVDWEGYPGIRGTTRIKGWEVLGAEQQGGWTGHIRDGREVLERDRGAR
jgi:hypothetical protein